MVVWYGISAEIFYECHETMNTEDYWIRISDYYRLLLIKEGSIDKRIVRVIASSKKVDGLLETR